MWGSAGRAIVQYEGIKEMGEYLDRFRLSFVDPDEDIASWDYDKLKEDFQKKE